MKALEKLFELRRSLDTYEREMGFDQLSEVEKSVLEFVMHSKDANITKITKDQYFAKYSLSTIKRAVGVLITENIITATQSSVDKRAMVLEYNK
jgi:DNA-binding MarR family transcriptional regulator